MKLSSAEKPGRASQKCQPTYAQLLTHYEKSLALFQQSTREELRTQQGNISTGSKKFLASKSSRFREDSSDSNRVLRSSVKQSSLYPTLTPEEAEKVAQELREDFQTLDFLLDLPLDQRILKKSDLSGYEPLTWDLLLARLKGYNVDRAKYWKTKRHYSLILCIVSTGLKTGQLEGIEFRNWSKEKGISLDGKIYHVNHLLYLARKLHSGFKSRGKAISSDKVFPQSQRAMQKAVNKVIGKFYTPGHLRKLFKSYPVGPEEFKLGRALSVLNGPSTLDRQPEFFKNKLPDSYFRRGPKGGFHRRINYHNE